MPDFLMDYHQWWLTFWADHPILFWVAAGYAVAIAIVARRLRRRAR